MGIISIKNLVHRFSKYGDNGEEIGEKTALEQVSLDIEKGSFVAILGHNGSGKSTLAKHLNALLLPTEGTVYISDKLSSDEKNLWKIRQSTGMVFQNPDNQIVANVVEEDVGFGPENMGVPTEEIWKRVNESLKAVGMEAYRMQSPNKLSGGQKQRVAIAGIMAMKPQIIVMDEPTAMLDPSGRKEVLDTVHELNKKEKITVILITHYMEEVIDADRVVVVDGGRIVDDGTPRGIFSQVEQLKRYHLDVPQVTELAWELKKDGLPFKDGVLSVNEFTDEFKRVCDADFSVHGAQVSGKENYSENNCSKTMNSEQEKVLLQLSHVTHVYDPDSKESFPALNDLSLSIHKNEFIGIIGHTGSGKSTLIQHLNGLMKPTSGTITYDGKDIWQDGYPLKELRSKVGLVFQYPEYQLFEESVFKDVCFGPKNQGLIEDEVKARATEALKMVGIDESLYEASPFELSGGQKRRVAIAGVLAMNPQILILDEPTAGLDPKGRDDILGQIAKLQKERGITIVLVSHSMEDVAQYASRILVVNGGKIVFDDKPRKVFEHEKELHEMGLAIPQVTQLMHRLKSEGYPVFENAITVQEARKNLLMYFQGKKKQDCKSKDQNNQDQKSQIESRRKPEEKTV